MDNYVAILVMVVVGVIGWSVVWELKDIRKALENLIREKKK